MEQTFYLLCYNYNIWENFVDEGVKRMGRKMEARDNTSDSNSSRMKNTYLREMEELKKTLASEVSKQQDNASSKTNRTKKEGNQIQQESEYNYNEHRNVGMKQSKGKLPLWAGFIISFAFILVAIAIIVCGNAISKTALKQMGFIEEEQAEETINELGDNISTTPSMKTTSIPTITSEVTPTPLIEAEKDEVYHVVLLGIESLEGVDRSDTIIVACMNVTDGTVGLIQIMGDLYVEIPGYGDDKLSKAYQFGGGALICDTVHANFNLPIEGYLSVNFNNFEHIIDDMGGVTIKLTKEEAQYLNTTNYISLKSNRTMVEGKQVMNGNQALGYCRIKEVPTASNSSSQIGRMERATAVMQGLIGKVRKMSFGDLIYTMNATLPYIRTNLTKDKFQGLLELLSQIDLNHVASIRIPLSEMYEKKTIDDVVVYIPKLEEIQAKLNTFIYGEEEE